MDIIEKYSKLHKELQLQEYAIPFKNLDKFTNKEEFVQYMKYYQIDNNEETKKYIIKFMKEIRTKDEFVNYADFLKIEDNEETKKYIIKFMEEIKTKDEFLEYIKIFKIERYILLELIFECKYLNFLYEYLYEDIHYYLSGCLQNEKFNDKNLEYISKYIDIINLDACNNLKITTVKPFAKTLKILNAGWSCGINDDGLLEASNLEKLCASGNSKITTVEPFAKTLKNLSASGNCGIDDNGLSYATNLEELFISNNFKITKIEHFILLKTLNIHYYNKLITSKKYKRCLQLDGTVSLRFK